MKVLFTAEYCQPCKAVKKYLQENDIEVTVYDITTSEGVELARKYSVGGVPTLMDIPHRIVGADKIISYLRGLSE